MLRFAPSDLDQSWRVDEIRWAPLPYKRPRCAGKNARLDTHGWGGDVPVAMIRMGDVTGFGWCRLKKPQADALIGTPVGSIFTPDGMLREAYYGLEFPLLDWLGNALGQPVFRLAARAGFNPPKNAFTVPVYDTSIYFDELDVEDDKAAVDKMCGEVDFGLSNGHTNFKVKIGRCGMWMDLDSGLKRDIDIVLAVRDRIGPAGKLMVDANNGYNLNLTKAFLKATASAKLHWLEEPFHEDDSLYTNLKAWMKQTDIATRIADGEGYACPAIERWAAAGLVDILQYDLRGYGYFRWMLLAGEMDRHGVMSAPHNYGGFYGNYASAHIAASIGRFALAEWDQAEARGIDASAYAIKNGMIRVPENSGFGLTLDEAFFDSQTQENGWNAGH